MSPQIWMWMQKEEEEEEEKAFFCEEEKSLYWTTKDPKNNMSVEYKEETCMKYLRGEMTKRKNGITNSNNSNNIACIFFTFFQSKFVSDHFYNIWYVTGYLFRLFFICDLKMTRPETKYIFFTNTERFTDLGKLKLQIVVWF